jgi:hypothetical protein
MIVSTVVVAMSGVANTLHIGWSLTMGKVR